MEYVVRVSEFGQYFENIYVKVKNVTDSLNALELENLLINATSSRVSFKHFNSSKMSLCTAFVFHASPNSLHY